MENLIAISDLFQVTLDELLREGAAQSNRMQQKPEPRYWDYVNGKWWLPLVLSGVSYLCIYLSTFLYALVPGLAGTVNETAKEFNLLYAISWIVGPVGFGILFRVLPWVSAAFLIVAFVKWQKAKN